MKLRDLGVGYGGVSVYKLILSNLHKLNLSHSYPNNHRTCKLSPASLSAIKQTELGSLTFAAKDMN